MSPSVHLDLLHQLTVVIFEIVQIQRQISSENYFFRFDPFCKSNKIEAPDLSLELSRRLTTSRERTRWNQLSIRINRWQRYGWFAEVCSRWSGRTFDLIKVEWETTQCADKLHNWKCLLISAALWQLMVSRDEANRQIERHKTCRRNKLWSADAHANWCSQWFYGSNHCLLIEMKSFANLPLQPIRELCL